MSIDEQVGKKLGWKSHNYDAFSVDPVERIPCFSAPNGDLYGCLPPYTTSIEVAWELTEKVPYFCLVKPLKSDQWKCDMGTQDSIVVMWADTAPLAICKAFLNLHTEEQQVFDPGV